MLELWFQSGHPIETGFLNHYFNADGHPVSTFFDNRVIGLSLADLQQIPWSVVVAGDAEKQLVIYASLTGRYFNVLVTDTITAACLLHDHQHSDKG